MTVSPPNPISTNTCRSPVVTGGAPTVCSAVGAETEPAGETVMATATAERGTPMSEMEDPVRDLYARVADAGGDGPDGNGEGDGYGPGETQSVGGGGGTDLVYYGGRGRDDGDGGACFD